MQDHLMHLLEDKLFCVLLCKGVDDAGVASYCYVAVSLRDMPVLAEKQQAGEYFSPADVGEILAQGQGEPDAATRQRMEEEYGFEYGQGIVLVD